MLYLASYMADGAYTDVSDGTAQDLGAPSNEGWTCHTGERRNTHPVLETYGPVSHIEMDSGLHMNLVPE